jgi:LmbE family N-acetylglucosaminyl deacetylase
LNGASALLGLPEPISLGLPDGRLNEYEQELTVALIRLLGDAGPRTWCAATWRGDGHPDHEAVGRAAHEAARAVGAVFVEYPIWMWHWGRPGDPDVPWDCARSTGAPHSAYSAKSLAVQCFRSQLSPTVDPVLPDFVVDRLLAVQEVLFCAEPPAR